MIGQHAWAAPAEDQGREEIPPLPFRFSTPGVVHVHHKAEGVETTPDLGLDPDRAPSSRVLPHFLPPSGLSFERRTYLHEKIHQFVLEQLRDIVCR